MRIHFNFSSTKTQTNISKLYFKFTRQLQSTYIQKIFRKICWLHILSIKIQRLLKAIIYHGYLEMVKLLLGEGMTHRITRNGGDGKSPLEGAQEKGKQNVANYLISKCLLYLEEYCISQKNGLLSIAQILSPGDHHRMDQWN